MKLILSWWNFEITALPEFISSQDVDVDHFWAAMAEQDITDSASLRFGTLAQLAKALLVLPYFNADPERLQYSQKNWEWAKEMARSFYSLWLAKHKN